MFIFLKIITVGFLWWIFSLIIPVKKADIEQWGEQEELKPLYFKKWILFEVLSFLIGFGGMFFTIYLMKKMAASFFDKQAAIYLVGPDSVDYTIPAIGFGSVIGVLAWFALAKLLTKDRFPQFLHYHNLRNKLRTPILAIIGTVLTFGLSLIIYWDVAGQYIAFKETKMEIGDRFSDELEVYPYDQMQQFAYVLNRGKLMDRDTVPDPHYVLTLPDSSLWDSEHDGSYDDEVEEEILEILLEKIPLPVDTLVIHPQELPWKTRNNRSKEGNSQ